MLQAKGGKRLVVEEEAVADTAAIQAWVDKYLVKGGTLSTTDTGYCLVNPDWFSTPEDILLVRELENAGVDMLLEEFCKGIFNLKITVLVWADVPAVNSQYSCKSFLVDTSLPTPPRPFQVIGGNHSAHAMKKGKQLFPKKKMFAQAKCRVLLVPRTQENIDMALMFGNLDNRAAQSVVKTSQMSVVRQFRRQWLSVQADTSLTPSQKVAAFAAYKKKVSPQIPFTHNTQHTFSALCCLPESVFSRMDKIFWGQYVRNSELRGQSTPPTAMTHFVNMSGIDEEQLCKWLQRVIDGVWSTATFNTRCILHKKTIRVMEQVMEYINILKPTMNFTSWPNLCRSYPMCEDGGWFDGILNACPDAVKSVLPAHCKSLIEMMVANQDRAASTVPVSVLKIMCLCVLFLRVCFYRFLICTILNPNFFAFLPCM